MRAPALMATAAAASLLSLHIWVWGFYISDDAFISMRYAQRLLDGHGLTWTDGPPVEGYSNLLWVLATAALGALGLDLLVAVRALGVACSLGVVAVLGRHFGREPVGAWVAGVGVASSASIALWAVGGLEQPLLCLLWAVALTGLGRALSDPEGPGPRAVVVPAVALALACLTRPDTPVLVACLTLGWFLAAGQDRRAARSALTLAAIPAAATLAQVGLRLALYGDFVPNTARVKVRPSEAHTDAGALWTAQALDNHLPLLALAALAFVAWPAGEPARARVRMALPVLGGWLAYLVWVGGDIFPAFRHFAPMVVLLAWLAGSAAAGLVARRRWMGLAVALAAPLALGWMTHDQHAHPVVWRAHNEAWVLAGLEVGRSLGAAFEAEQPRMAVSPAGSMPYGSGLPALDMLGLNDAHISRVESEGGWIGHELGDGDYVFARAPDLVFFCGPKGGPNPCFGSEKQLAARADWAETYALVSWSTGGSDPVDYQPWVRRQGRIGVQSDPEGAAVPGWLLAEGGGVARPGPGGPLALHLDAHESASLDPTPLPPGRYTPRGDGVARVALSGPGVVEDGDGWRVNPGASPRVTVTAGPSPVIFDAAAFDRTP